MADPNLKLNSLSRFSKQSYRLALEVHGHCEVPAGCGGVVLKWRLLEASAQPIPMRMRFFSTNGKRDPWFLDHTSTEAVSKVPVTYGKHALSLVVREFDPTYALVLMVCQLDENYVRFLQPEGDTILLSLPDDTWKFTLKPPASEVWRHPDFDDSSWQSMVEKPFAPLPGNYGGDVNYWTKDLTDQGAMGLGIDFTPSSLQRFLSQFGRNPSPPAVYIRKTFAVTKRRPEG